MSSAVSTNTKTKTRWSSSQASFAITAEVMERKPILRSRESHITTAEHTHQRQHETLLQRCQMPILRAPRLHCARCAETSAAPLTGGAPGTSYRPSVVRKCIHFFECVWSLSRMKIDHRPEPGESAKDPQEATAFAKMWRDCGSAAGLPASVDATC